MPSKDPNDHIRVSLKPGKDGGALWSLTWLIALACSTGLIAYLLWDDATVPRRSVQFGVAKIRLDGDVTQTVTARTRIVSMGQSAKHEASAASHVKQIQLPDGRWIDCRGNCAATYIESAFH